MTRKDVTRPPSVEGVQGAGWALAPRATINAQRAPMRIQQRCPFLKTLDRHAVYDVEDVRVTPLDVEPLCSGLVYARFNIGLRTHEE